MSAEDVRWLPFPSPEDEPDEVRTHRNTCDPRLARRIAMYLAAGHRVAVVPVMIRDVFDDERMAGPGHILTDGVWVWPEYVAYFVQVHRIAIDPQFVARMRSNNWIVPSLREAELVRIADAIAPE